MSEFILTYSHNIIEHLGLKLYQNQPTRVIAELVSNSWDADAENVHIKTEVSEPRWVAVQDDGHGMSRALLQKAYLVVGHAKRAAPGDRSPKGRLLMGRKGIGKLAAFGIARQIDLVTVSKDGDQKQLVWLRFDRDSLLGQGDGEVSYHPAVIADGISPNEAPLHEDLTGQVKDWMEFLAEGTGTLVLMSKLSIVRSLNNDQLLKSLGSRFTISTGGLLNIYVNGEKVGVDNSLPPLEFRIPAEGTTTVDLDDGRKINYWVGFVGSAEWPQDQAGVGVYAHGKIAQDRPFFFGVKGREIWTRYMLGFVEADWLDELDADLISTDRTSINWDAPEVEALHARGQALTRDWLNKYALWRAEREGDINRKLVRKLSEGGGVAKVTEAEENEIIRLVSEITPSFDRADEVAKERLISAVSAAWVQKPMRKLIRDLWRSFSSSGDSPPKAFAETIERLSSHSVPEALNLAVIFGQRAFALTRLHDYVHNGIETDLQRLLEYFPWIIEPDSTVLTANESLRKAALKAAELDLVPGAAFQAVVGGVSESHRPDFVFLSSPNEHEIVVVELKNPQIDLTVDNVAQLHGYMLWLQTRYPQAAVKGYLVGTNPSDLKSRYDGTAIVPWVDVLNRSRARNLELLAAMLLKSGDGSATDARSLDAVELGGDAAKRLLERLAEDHSEIRALVERFRPAGEKGEVDGS